MKRLWTILILLGLSSALWAQPEVLIDAADSKDRLVASTEVNGQTHVIWLSFTGGPDWSLYTTDGTRNGTQLVKSGLQNWNWSTFSDWSGLMETAGNRSYFIHIGNGHVLWSSDGTEAGTQVIKAFPPGKRIEAMTDLNGILYFWLYDPNTGRGDLWKSDGTASGTTFVLDSNPGFSGKWGFEQDNPPNLFASNNRLFAIVDEMYEGSYPGSYEFNSSRTRFIWAIDPLNLSMESLYPVHEMEYNPEFYHLQGQTAFMTRGGDFGLIWESLYKTDGTAAGTNFIFSPASGLPGAETQWIEYKDGVAALTRYGSTTSAQVFQTLWFGSSNLLNWQSVGPLEASHYSSFSSFLANHDYVFFHSKDQNGSIQLMRSDGTASGTLSLKGDLVESGLVTDGHLVLFEGPDPLGCEEYINTDASLSEPYITDGTPQGTKLLKDLVPGCPGSLVWDKFIPLQKGFIISNAWGFYYTDGTEEGTQKVSSIRGGYWLSSIGFHQQIGDHLIYTHGTENGPLYGYPYLQPFVSSYHLIDADEDTVIGALSDGMTVQIGPEPAMSPDVDLIVGEEDLTVEAVIAGPLPGSVTFQLNPGNQNQTENRYPWALNGDNNGNFSPADFHGQDQTLVVSIYEEGNKGGAILNRDTIHFSLIRVNNRISDLLLVDADQNQIIGPLQDGDRIYQNGAAPAIEALELGDSLILGAISLVTSTFDIGTPLAAIDGNSNTLWRSQQVNPAQLTLTFNQSQRISRVQILAGQPGFTNIDQDDWWLEAADSQQDMDRKTGSYRMVIPRRTDKGGITDVVDLAVPEKARIYQLNVERTKTDDYVHLWDWQLFDLDGLSVSGTTLGFEALSIVSPGSVQFGLDGNSSYSVENYAPYSLAGDNQNGDYHGVNLSPGFHSIVSTPFEGRNASGDAGDPYLINVEVLPVTARFERAAMLKIWPNPAQSSVLVELQDMPAGKAILSLHDLSGQQVKTLELDHVGGPLQQKINLSDLPAGMYILRVDHPEQVLSRMISIIR